MPFAPLLDFEDDGSKVQRVAENLRGRLPLATSLAAPTVAAELELPLPLVETAFRIVAAEGALTLEQVDSFGLVLSQPQI
jgi:hypothetical protein